MTRVEVGWSEIYEFYKTNNPTALYPKCGHEKVTVEVATDYGDGFWWKGIGCVECGTFHGPFDPSLAQQRLYEHNQYGILFKEPMGISPDLAAFEGEEPGLPDWWPV